MNRAISGSEPAVYVPPFGTNEFPIDALTEIFKRVDVFTFPSLRLTNKTWCLFTTQNDRLITLFQTYFGAKEISAPEKIEECFKKEWQNSWKLRDNLKFGRYVFEHFKICAAPVLFYLYPWKTGFLCVSMGQTYVYDEKKWRSRGKCLQRELELENGAELAFSSGKIYHGLEKKLEVIDLVKNRRSSLGELEDGAGTIVSLEFHQDKLFVKTTSSKGELIVFDLLTYQWLKTPLVCKENPPEPLSHNEVLKGAVQKKRVSPLFLERIMVEVTEEGGLHLINLETKSSILKRFSTDNVTAINLVENKMVLGFATGCIGILEASSLKSIEDIASGKCKLLKKVHQEAIEMLIQAEHGKMFSISLSGLICIWDFTTPDPTSVALKETQNYFHTAARLKTAFYDAGQLCVAHLDTGNSGTSRLTILNFSHQATSLAIVKQMRHLSQIPQKERLTWGNKEMFSRLPELVKKQLSDYAQLALKEKPQEKEAAMTEMYDQYFMANGQERYSLDKEFEKLLELSRSDETMSTVLQTSMGINDWLDINLKSAREKLKKQWMSFSQVQKAQLLVFVQIAYENNYDMNLHQFICNSQSNVAWNSKGQSMDLGHEEDADFLKQASPLEIIKKIRHFLGHLLSSPKNEKTKLTIDAYFNHLPAPCKEEIRKHFEEIKGEYQTLKEFWAESPIMMKMELVDRYLFTSSENLTKVEKPWQDANIEEQQKTSRNIHFEKLLSSKASLLQESMVTWNNNLWNMSRFTYSRVFFSLLPYLQEQLCAALEGKEGSHIDEKSWTEDLAAKERRWSRIFNLLKGNPRLITDKTHEWWTKQFEKALSNNWKPADLEKVWGMLSPEGQEALLYFAASAEDT